MAQTQPEQPTQQQQNVPQNDMIQEEMNNEKVEFNQEIMEELVKQQNYQDLARRAELTKTQYRAFKRLKWKSQIYLINESVRINFKEKQKIGIIKRIVSVKSFADSSELPLVQVNWYVNKQELDQKWEQYIKSFSDFELFLTEISDFIFIGSIMDKVKVLSLNEYDSFLDEDNSEQNKIFFMRCTYNEGNKNINPDPSQLEKVCMCEMPQNPDLVYIYCDNCKKWLHMECVHLTEEEAKDIEEYVCIKCQQ